MYVRMSNKRRKGRGWGRGYLRSKLVGKIRVRKAKVKAKWRRISMV